MKIFISHSSKNKNYGNEFVNLLTGVGVKGEDIIFTSNDAYGIPIGENIFQWLKSRITEKPHVIYLLSPKYYKSVACLNEMGAPSWSKLPERWFKPSSCVVWINNSQRQPKAIKLFSILFYFFV